jgi:hypothetical protein
VSGPTGGGGSDPRGGAAGPGVGDQTPGVPAGTGDEPASGPSVTFPEPAVIVGTIVDRVTDGVVAAVKPAVVAAVAEAFSFPLVLMIAVVLFLLGQGRFDGRDPKFRMAPLTRADTTVPFEDEVIP